MAKSRYEQAQDSRANDPAYPGDVGMVDTIVSESANGTTAMPAKMVSYRGKRVKWETPGQTVEGRITRKNYIPMRDGSAAIQYTLDGGPDGALSFLAGVQVAEALAEVPFGTYVKIRFNGKEKGGMYGQYNDFEIMGEVLAERPMLGPSPIYPALGPGKPGKADALDQWVDVGKFP